VELDEVNRVTSQTVQTAFDGLDYSIFDVI